MKKRNTDQDQIHRSVEEFKDGSFLANAQRRSRRRKSPWNLLLPLFALPLWATFVFASVQIAWLVHVLIYPEHAGLERQFFSGGMRLSDSLMFLPFLPAAIFPAFLVTNFLVYLIPAARRAMDQEDKAYPGTDYASSQSALTRAGIAFYGVALLLAVIGAAIGASIPPANAT